MSLSLVGVIVLVLGLLLHWSATGSSRNGSATLAELGRSMIWIGLFFVVAPLASHGAIPFSR
jgi:hypothetical protein